MYRAADIDRSHQAVTLTDVRSNYFLIVIKHANHGLVLVARLLQVPHFNALVHGARDQLCLVEHDRRDEVIVRLELVDACARLEAEDVNVEVLASEGEALLTTQLARD